MTDLVFFLGIILLVGLCVGIYWRLIYRSTTNMNLEKTGQEISNSRKKMFGLGVMIVLFLVGLITLPFGILFWIIGFLLYWLEFSSGRNNNRNKIL